MDEKLVRFPHQTRLGQDARNIYFFKVVESRVEVVSLIGRADGEAVLGKTLLCYIYSLQPMEVYVDDEAKLTLHGLQQHYVKLKENEKNKKLFDLLDALEFNQVTFSNYEQIFCFDH